MHHEFNTLVLTMTEKSSHQIIENLVTVNLKNPNYKNSP